MSKEVQPVFLHVLQVLSTFAQMTDLCLDKDAAKPVHVVAEARGPLLEGFADKIQVCPLSPLSPLSPLLSVP